MDNTKLRDAHIEATLRTIRAHASLGFSMVGRAILYTMLKDEGDWTASSIAAYTGLPRQTVSRKLAEMVSYGAIEKTANGWTVAPTHRPLAVQMVDETIEIVLGNRSSFSTEIIAFSKPKRVSRFLFPPLPRWD